MAAGKLKLFLFLCPSFWCVCFQWAVDYLLWKRMSSRSVACRSRRNSTDWSRSRQLGTICHQVNRRSPTLTRTKCTAGWPCRYWSWSRPSERTCGIRNGGAVSILFCDLHHRVMSMNHRILMKRQLESTHRSYDLSWIPRWKDRSSLRLWRCRWRGPFARNASGEPC